MSGKAIFLQQLHPSNARSLAIPRPGSLIVWLPLFFPFAQPRAGSYVKNV